MSSRNFRALLEARWAEGKFVCVGLDSEFDKIPASAHRSGNECNISVENTVVGFNSAIVEATKDLVCAYKPNIAFYEAHGPEGLSALHRTIMDIRVIAPDVPVILDAKRADIGNTNAGYVKAAFGFMRADALTVNPYFGKEALQPFLEQKDKGIIVLCRTSNPGAGEFQDLVTLTRDPRQKPDNMSAEEWLALLCSDAMPLYERVGQNVAHEWNKHGNCLLVIGATYPVQAQAVRRRVGDLSFLVPGVGKQGGDVQATVLATIDSRGWGIIVNSSGGIIFASSESDFADAARRETQRLHDLINQYRYKEMSP